MLPTFRSACSSSEVIKRENLLHVDSIKNRLRMFLVGKKQQSDYQDASICSQRRDAGTAFGSDRKSGFRRF